MKKTLVLHMRGTDGCGDPTARSLRSHLNSAAFEDYVLHVDDRLLFPSAKLLIKHILVHTYFGNTGSKNLYMALTA